MSKIVKNQHWVPCSYLQFFDVDCDPKGRKSVVCFTDGKVFKRSKVERLAVSKYTYTQKKSSIERGLSERESNIAKVIRKISINAEITALERLYLILDMFFMHHRNIAIENRTEEERERIVRRIADILGQKTINDGKSVRLFTRDEYHKYIIANWEVFGVTAPDGRCFITSDNPAIIVVKPLIHKPVCVFLPITPNLCLVAFNKNEISIKSQYTNFRDVRNLNAMQVHSCTNHVFSSFDISNTREMLYFDLVRGSCQKTIQYVDDGGYGATLYLTSHKIFEDISFLDVI